MPGEREIVGRVAPDSVDFDDTNLIAPIESANKCDLASVRAEQARFGAWYFRFVALRCQSLDGARHGVDQADRAIDDAGDPSAVGVPSERGYHGGRAIGDLLRIATGWSYEPELHHPERILLEETNFGTIW